MPTMRQLVTSNPGSSWMRTPNYQQQVSSARAQFPSVSGAVGYGGSMSSGLGNQVGNANRAYSLGMPNAASHLPSNMGSFGDGRTTDVNELRNQQSALRSYMEMTPGLNQGLPEFAGQRADLSRQRDALQTQIDSAMQSQWAENQARINARVAADKARSARAKETGAVAMQGVQGAMRANPGMQKFQQDMYWDAVRQYHPAAMKAGGDVYQSPGFQATARLGRQAGEHYAEAQAQRSAPGGPAQWGWDGGRGTYQPLNQSAQNASFGPRDAPSQAFQQAQAAQRQAYQMPAQQHARTQQLIYGYGGF